MSQIKVDTITNAAGTGAVDFPNGLSVGGTAFEELGDFTYSTSTPSDPSNGDIYFVDSSLHVRVGGTWRKIILGTTDTP